MIRLCNWCAQEIQKPSVPMRARKWPVQKYHGAPYLCHQYAYQEKNQKAYRKQQALNQRRKRARNAAIRFAYAYQKKGNWKHRICPKRKRARGAKKKARLTRIERHADRERTAARKFISPFSYIARDGREVLDWPDWKLRSAEVCERDKGMCRGCAEPHYIGESGHAHHVIWRSKRRDDSMANLIYVCPEIHVRIHGRVPQWSAKEVFSASDTELVASVTRPNLNAEGK